MLSFKVINKENIDEMLKFHSARAKGKEEKETVREIIKGFVLSETEDIEYAFNVSFSCLLVRICDMGRYAFPFPFELSENADFEKAISAVEEYAMREEIPLVFSDVPPEMLSFFAGFRHMNIDAEDGAELTYRVRIKTECELLWEIPELTCGRITLSALSDADTADFARLSRDTDSLKYWGYDYRADVGDNVADTYFIETAREEFARGLSISLAVRADGKFVGETLLYGFCGHGSAELAIRILPELRGFGFGSEALSASIEYAEKIGLTALYARIFKENIPSLKMASKHMEQVSEDFDTISYATFI